MSTLAQIKQFATKYGIKNYDLIQTGAFINGQWENEFKETFAVTNPATGEKLLDVVNTPISKVNEAIDNSKVGFEFLSKSTTGRERSNLLYKLFQLIEENADDLARLITAENGKPLADALGEVKYGSSFFQWFAEEAPRVYGDAIPSASGAKRIISIKQPIGPVGILTPWNFPAAMITRKVGAAIAAGCSSVIKPATETPLTALAIARLADKAGFPAGSLNMVPVDVNRTPEVGKLLCESPTIMKVSFTGSTGVGQLLMRQSASTLKKLSFELGGNAPFIVFDDADVDKAVAAAMGCKLRQSGQTCVCANRLYIQSGVYDKFADALTAQVKKQRLGNGLDQDTTHGPLIHERAVAKVDSQVQDAISKGATVLTGGKPATELGPNFYNLTVLKDVPKTAIVNKQETFGPLVPLIKFDTEDEVIEIANDTEYGLAGYFFTNDYARLIRVAEGLHVGMVGANTGSLGEAALPFGGVGWSGFGREGSKYGVDDYVVIKSIVIGL